MAKEMPHDESPEVQGFSIMDSILGGLKTFYPEIGDHDPDKYAMALREGPYRLEPMVK